MAWCGARSPFTLRESQDWPEKSIIKNNQKSKASQRVFLRQLFFMYVQGHLALPELLSESLGVQNYFHNNTHMLLIFPQNVEKSPSRFSLKRAYLNHNDTTVVGAGAGDSCHILDGECFYLKTLCGPCNLQGRIKVPWVEERVPGAGRWVLGAKCVPAKCIC